MGIFNNTPGGWSGMSPDQSAMVNQAGWAPRPDMVLPTGTPNTQPQGYNGNLTPAQAATVGQLGYYSNPDATSPSGTNIFDKLGKVTGLLGNTHIPNPADAQNAAAAAGAQANQRSAMQQGGGGLSQLQQLMRQYGGASGLYDPSQLMQLLFQGTPPVGGMGSLMPGQQAAASSFSGRGRPG